MCASLAETVQCGAVAQRTGQPCRARAVAGSSPPRCQVHGPDAARFHRLGGAAHSNANRAAKLLPSRLQPVVALLEHVFAELYRNSGAQRTARDATALASVALAIGRLFQIGESEQRLRDLEASVAEWQRADRSRWGA
jgi:hypothetical protein